MSKIFSWFMGNPLAIMVVGLILVSTGFIGAWHIQGLRLDALQSKYDTFVSETKMQGELADKLNKAKIAEYERNKESADHDYQIALSNLNADVERLRNARAGSSFVPTAPAGTRRPDLACFDRVELEQSIRTFDTGLQKLVDEGSQNTLALNTAKVWAQGIRNDTRR